MVGFTSESFQNYWPSDFSLRSNKMKVKLVEFLGIINCPVFLKLLKHSVLGTGSIPVLRCWAGGTYSVGSIGKS